MLLFPCILAALEIPLTTAGPKSHIGLLQGISVHHIFCAYEVFEEAWFTITRTAWIKKKRGVEDHLLQTYENWINLVQ